MLNTTALDGGTTIGFSVTVTMHDALKLLPSAIVAVIVACPSFIAVTLPF
ncbi:hypothetical protein CLPUN_00010 [Clostridium puniceum]|uniref:Uncharacterized protein n=1 Tax=Clostridium puniceum TaxID=29367 RepID=A0A1S8TYX7_9CLOT|nr:hypothetical protein CLPUN_00010 [Clostridium puniceum]